MKGISSTGNIIEINPETRPKTFRKLRGILNLNGGRDCFSKSDGFIWKISKEGTWVNICRNIDQLTFSEYLKLSLS